MEADDARDGATGRGDGVPEPYALTSRRGDATTPPATAAAAAPVRSTSSPFGWLFDDLGLKAVALVLAVTTWVLIRDQIQDVRSIDGVAVVLDRLPPSIRVNVASMPRITVNLQGTAGAVERARLALEGAGHQVRLRLRTSAENHGPTVLANVSDFTFPFSDVGVVESITPAVRVEWYRVASLEVDVAFDKTSIEHPGRVDLDAVSTASSMERTKVLVTGPVALIDELRPAESKLVPDAVSADQWLRTNPDFATPFPWSSGFATWRSKDPVLRAPWLLTIDPPTVAGKTKFREYTTTPVEVDLQILYPPGFDATAYEKYDVKIPDNGYDARARRLNISVRGDPAVITSLGTGHSGWTLLVQFPRPPKDDATSVTDHPAPIVLIPPEVAAGETSPRLRLVSPRTLFVTLVKRKGP